MADNDVFLKSIGSCWKKCYEAAHGCGDAWEVADLSVEGVCRLLRAYGCPDFERYRALLVPFCAQEGQPSLFSGDGAEAAAQCEMMANRHAGDGMKSALAQIESRVAQRMLLEAQMTEPLHGDAGQLFAARLLPEVFKSLSLDRFDTAQKVNERFLAANNGDAAQANAALFDFCDEVSGYLEQVFAPIAAKLAADPTGQSLPKRPKRMPKRSTAELNILVVST